MTIDNVDVDVDEWVITMMDHDDDHII